MCIDYPTKSKPMTVVGVRLRGWFILTVFVCALWSASMPVSASAQENTPGVTVDEFRLVLVDGADAADGGNTSSGGTENPAPDEPKQGSPDAGGGSDDECNFVRTAVSKQVPRIFGMVEIDLDEIFVGGVCKP